MSNDPVDGGTVTYHRAEYLPDIEPRAPWKVWFTAPGEGTPRNFTLAEGEAMGLTPPERESKAFSVVLDELIVVDPHDDITREQVAESIVGMLEVAGLLRDARQDPQPASDENAPGSATPGEQGAGVTCTPAPDTDSGIDFDALPIGTVLRDRWGDLLLRRAGGWFEGDEDYFLNAGDGPYTVVHQPAPLSPGECLRGLLAGRDDADRLLRGAAESWYAGPRPIWWSTLRGVIGDAAREVHG